jgi:ABC-type sulfate transport system permease subunit
MKIKVFCAAAGEVAEQVNEWLGEVIPEKKIEIVNMFHATSTVNSGTVFVTVTFIYRDLVSQATDTTPAKYE